MNANSPTWISDRVRAACRHLLSQQDRDPSSQTCGCFDRRHWGWKLVDFPEATFQRNVYPLACLATHADADLSDNERRVFAKAALDGIRFAIAVQHTNGSFDQAFPNEQSFGATAFLVSPLLRAFRLVGEGLPSSRRAEIETGLRRAATFLCDHDETHGFIANHLAGAALSLLEAGRYFGEPRFVARSEALLQRVLESQHDEGWFVEYEGADPGYQTLCLYYLAHIREISGNDALTGPLERAVQFLAWFIHPDGSFAGEYGSRRTAIFYAGGFALLSRRSALAKRMLERMAEAAADGATVTLDDVDMGNIGPLLANYVDVLEVANGAQPTDTPRLPYEEAGIQGDFPAAGLFVRSTERYYAVLGASNGGVLKVFDRANGEALCNDGGYIGRLDDGRRITTQVTLHNRVIHHDAGTIEVVAPFFQMLQTVPTPAKFWVLRLLNLTFMRSIRLGNLIKSLLVHGLITAKREVAMRVERRIEFAEQHLVVRDRLVCGKGVSVSLLEQGRPFVGIHMASAGYFEGFVAARDAVPLSPQQLARLRAAGELFIERSIG